jgi:hypothetical protein
MKTAALVAFGALLVTLSAPEAWLAWSFDNLK